MARAATIWRIIELSREEVAIERLKFLITHVDKKQWLNTY
jgi:hypothetical protein